MRCVVVLMLAGCVRSEPMAADQCGAGLVAGLMGQPFVALADVALPGALRVLYPGQEVSDPAQAARLSARVDGAGRISAVFCG